MSGTPWRSTVNPDVMTNLETTLIDMIVVFNYMRAVQRERQVAIGGVHAALLQFDILYGRSFPARKQWQMPPMWAEYMPQWDIRVINWNRRFIRRRLTLMANTYRQHRLNGGDPTLVADVLAAIWRLRNEVMAKILIT
ncbi:hypothetical protein BBP40_008046 [Aspergillus hancockii]|nr:hypothetical protein BBP40_008046 [Aspergillus hancockii]